MTALRAAPTLRDAVQELVDAEDADCPDENAPITGAEYVRQLDEHMARRKAAWVNVRAALAHPPEGAQTINVAAQEKATAARQPQTGPGLSAPVAATPTEGAQPEPAGWKLVPIEPTQAMLDKGRHTREQTLLSAYKAMLAAAPKIEGAQTLPAAREEDAVHGRCAGWLRLFKFKHGRDPFPQEVWDAALVLGYQTAAALPTPPNAQETKT